MSNSNLHFDPSDSLEFVETTTGAADGADVRHRTRRVHVPERDASAPTLPLSMPIEEALRTQRSPQYGACQRV
jgi:hypothetical protein